MDSKELAEKVIADVKSAPQIFDGIKKEVELIIKKIIIDNATEILKLETEEKFFNFLTIVLDSIIVLPYPYEMLDSTIIKFLLKNVVDKILDKYAGTNWYEKLKDLIDKSNK